MHIDRLCLIGTGLIGGSLALALKRADVCAHVAGFDRDRAALDDAVQAGILDSAHDRLDRAVSGADVIVLAVPVGAMETLFAELAPLLTPGVVLTDVGSTKVNVITAARAALGPRCAAFVPGHPIAGTEKSGPRHAFADLFRDRITVLTPLPENAPADVARVRALWEGAGAVVQELDAAHHDQVLAATSHLPHLLAYALVDCLARMEDGGEIFRFAAGGFADFTRIASSSPEMWRDVCAANREPLLQALDRYTRELGALRDAVARGDSAALLEIFRRARDARAAFAARRAEPKP